MYDDEEQELLERAKEEEEEQRREAYKEWLEKETQSMDALFEQLTEGEGIESLRVRLIRKWDNLFGKTSVKNRVYGWLVLHVILGQIFRKIRIYNSPTVWKDLRVSLFNTADSGSGKSVAVNLIKRLCDLLNIPCEVITGDLNEATLIGSREPEEIIAGKRRTKVYKLNPGLLMRVKDGGITIVDEAEIMFKLGERDYNSTLVAKIQGTMNPIGSETNLAERRVKPEPIIIKPVECSWVFLSFIVRERMLPLMKTGFIQRTVTHARRLTRQEWRELTEELAKSKDKMLSIKGKEEWKKIEQENEYEILEIVNMLKEIQTFVNNPINKIERLYIKNSGEWAKWMQEFNNELDFLISGVSLNDEEEYTSEVKEVLNSFRARGEDWVQIFASHYALMDKRDWLEYVDFTYGKNLTINAFKSVVSMIENLKEVARGETASSIAWERFKRERQVLLRRMEIEKQGGINSKKFKEVLMDFLGVSESTVDNYLKDWEKQKLIRREKKGNSWFIYL
jgi:hypothetical protein